MTNNAFHRLMTEWEANKINEFAESLRLEAEIDADNPSMLKLEEMKAIRQTCKAKHVWLEDSCEADIYIAAKPFGGHTVASVKELKAALKEYRAARKNGRANETYRRLMEQW